MLEASHKLLSVNEKSALLKRYYTELDSKYYRGKKRQVIVFLCCLKMSISGLPYYNQPAEVQSLILTCVVVIDLFNLSLRSKCFYAFVHNNVRLDENLRILKRKLAIILCLVILGVSFCPITKSCTLNLRNIILRLPFCLPRKLLDEIIFHVLPLRVYCHLFHAIEDLMLSISVLTARSLCFKQLYIKLFR